MSTFFHQPRLAQPLRPPFLLPLLNTRAVLTTTMSDDAPAAGGGGANGGAIHTAGDAPGHYDIPTQVNTSRRSTWTKEGANVHVSGTQTPMGSQMNRMSRLEPGIEDYFVCTSIYEEIERVDANRNRSAPATWKRTPSSPTSCVSTAPSHRE